MVELSPFNLLSRYHLIGFAVPIYIWLVVLYVALSEDWKPAYFDDLGLAQFGVLAVVTVVLSIFIVPWRHGLFAAYAGKLSRTKPDWPHFRYGKAIETWRREITSEWKKPYAEIWPRVRSVTTETEQAYLDEARTNAAAMVVYAVLCLVSIPLVGLDALLHRPQPWWVGVVVLGFVLLRVFQWQAVKAAERIGVQTKESVRLHFAEVMEGRQ